DSGQYDPNMTVGYNDIVTLSLHDLPLPPNGTAYIAWLMPDPGAEIESLPLGGPLQITQGKASLRYPSPDHTNLLAKYSGMCITEQSSNSTLIPPSPDFTSCLWKKWLPSTPTPGDPKQFSLLDHLRHLLAADPTLRDNSIPGGLVTWLTRNIGKV